MSNNDIEYVDTYSGKEKGLIKASLVTTILFLLGRVVILFSQDKIIMYYGIQFLKGLKIAFVFLLGASSLTFIGSTASYIIKKKQYMALEEKRYSQRLLEEREEENASSLSVNGKLNPKFIRDSLRKLKEGKYSYLSIELDDCIHQFEQMDSYQERYSNLLKSNGANSLSDTEDVIDQVEQYMCKNARNIINFMNVADEDTETASKVVEQLYKCQEENESLLKQTKDFIYAMTEFLNNQGGENDTRILETYKTTILSTIRKESAL